MTTHTLTSIAHRFKSMLHSYKQRWERDGYLVLPRFYSAGELDVAEGRQTGAWRDGAPRIVVDDLMTGQRVRMADVSEESRRLHRFKVNDLFLEFDEIRRLALNAKLTPVLTDLLGHVPVLCNSLSFEQGSGQPDHVDALYMTPRSEGHLIAIWVALEDCHPDAGPLRYYPGSHRIPQYRFSTGNAHFVDDEMPAWQSYMTDQVEKLGLRAELFPAQRGDVFIWSAHLLHGGSPIRDTARTRRSVVFHYYSEMDCRAVGCNLVPCAGGYWMYRPHQLVPGNSEAESPPLPAAAFA